MGLIDVMHLLMKKCSRTMPTKLKLLLEILLMICKRTLEELYRLIKTILKLLDNPMSKMSTRS